MRRPSLRHAEQNCVVQRRGIDARQQRTAWSTPAATVKNAANAAATDLRRQLGASAVNVIADISDDLCVPATIAATSSWSSPIIPAAGMMHVSFAGKLSQNGNAVINRYADVAGSLLVASTTANITANSAFPKLCLTIGRSQHGMTGCG